MHSVLSSAVAAVALESPNQAHQQPLAAGTQLQLLPGGRAGRGGITPNPQETEHSTWHVMRPQTLLGRTHACLLLQGSRFRTVLGCTHVGGLQRPEVKTATVRWVWEFTLGVLGNGEILPTPRFTPCPFFLSTALAPSERTE